MPSPTKPYQHLTIREASVLTRKSVSTIKRLVRELSQQDDDVDRELIQPSVEDVRQFRSAGRPFVWSIDQALLLKRFGKKSSKFASFFSQEAVDLRENSLAIVQVLRDQLQNKDRQIRTLEQQLDRKDDQIKGLNDRLHESNVLMRELQTRMAIASPVTKIAGRRSANVHADPKIKPKTPIQKMRRRRYSLLNLLVGR